MHLFVLAAVFSLKENHVHMQKRRNYLFQMLSHEQSAYWTLIKAVVSVTLTSEMFQIWGQEHALQSLFLKKVTLNYLAYASCFSNIFFCFLLQFISRYLEPSRHYNRRYFELTDIKWDQNMFPFYMRCENNDMESACIKLDSTECVRYAKWVVWIISVWYIYMSSTLYEHFLM
jgi:hypothetical protein